MDIVPDPENNMGERLPFYIITSYVLRFACRVLNINGKLGFVTWQSILFWEWIHDRPAAVEQRSHHMLMIGLAQLRAPLSEHSECVLLMQESWHMWFPKKVLTQMGSMLHPFSQRLSVPGQLNTVTSALNFSTASDSHAEDECRTKIQTTLMQLNFVWSPFSIHIRHIKLFLLLIPNYRVKRFT